MSAAPRRRLGLGFWSFVLLMLSLTGLFAWLGVWQVQRLAEKEALVATVERQLNAEPYDLPPADAWPALDLAAYAYHPLRLSGVYDPAGTVLVFTNLADAQGRYAGPGYWAMTPLAVEGGTVFVNRGFVPQGQAAAFRETTPPSGMQTVTGLALRPDTPGAFTPAPDTANRIEWVRDPARLAAMAGVEGPVFRLVVDAPAGAPGELPQGGETIVEFPNNHLGYALTWFGFALITPALLGVWVWRQLRPAG